MLIKSLHIKGMLSFKDVSLDLRPLNVLIGPNASGKSNLIEIIALLQSLPRDLSGFIRQSGGINDWLWKGDRNENGTARTGRVEAVLHPLSSDAHNLSPTPLHYRLEVGESSLYTTILEELLESELSSTGKEEHRQYFQMKQGKLLMRTSQANGASNERAIDSDVLSPGHSVLHEIRDPTAHSEMYWVRNDLDEIRLFREANLGRHSGARKPQSTDGASFFLHENFSNLALVLNRLQSTPAIREIEQNLCRFYEDYEQVGVKVEANTAQIWLRERGLDAVVPATRLSDGTLRYLALLTILCHPTPPPLICIEEPELGMHPDIMTDIAKLLIAASKRTQLIVTTHSKNLIDRLWEDPESVVICEKDFDSSTELNRLSMDKLERWLERYELGELWEKGELGGNRW